jgi:hypothetical protein
MRRPAIIASRCSSVLVALAVSAAASTAADALFTPPLSVDVLTFNEAGVWFVVQGGDTPNVNDHMAVQNQMYGLDFARCGGDGLRSLNGGDGNRVADYYSWGQPVLAPADGVVEAAVDDAADNPIGATDELKPFGNHVQIRLASGDHLVLAHFRKDSVEVRVGQVLTAGDRLGVVGNSGNSTYPHLHLHVQRGDGVGGHGLVPVFRNPHARIDGVVLGDPVVPLIRGMFIGTAP